MRNLPPLLLLSPLQILFLGWPIIMLRLMRRKIMRGGKGLLLVRGEMMCPGKMGMDMKRMMIVMKMMIHVNNYLVEETVVRLRFGRTVLVLILLIGRFWILTSRSSALSLCQI